MCVCVCLRVSVYYMRIICIMYVYLCVYFMCVCAYVLHKKFLKNFILNYHKNYHSKLIQLQHINTIDITIKSKNIRYI
ncbi:hypothetical protein C2G38_2091464 [Gigaspora rosea]|uniref:Uncharacterized protein n=1 Tax=Gigaspora rosea TaxID=44941 RepID=A0A397V146_9GLOM|nr:hypothetical protein C2G38_2091464 [Gigaspora rosea]